VPVYTHGHHESVLRSHRWRTAQNSAAYLLPRLKSDDRLLDVGVGPGTITVDFADRLTEGTVVGIDAAPAAVAAAQALVAEREVRNVTLSVGDVYELEFPAGSFDVVHAHQVLQHLSHPITALREMRRVCVLGGLVAVRDADYAAMTWYPPSVELSRWLELYHQVARSNGGEPDAGRRLLSWAQTSAVPEVLRSPCGSHSGFFTTRSWCRAPEALSGTTRRTSAWSLTEQVAPLRCWLPSYEMS